jgi:hypothetical protein
VVIVLLAACDPAPVPTGARPTASQVASPHASAPLQTFATPLPSPGPSASLQSAAIELPARFDAIPWADLPPGDGNEDSFSVSIGVLGKPATTTRTFARQPDIAADGNAVVLSDGRISEIIDAATGTTVASFEHAALELEDVPKHDLSYTLFSRQFRTDVARGYLYFLGGNRDGVQLRRFALDGSSETLLGVVAPDPGREPSYVDFVVTQSGDVVATACALEGEEADSACRLYSAAPRASRLSKPRFLASDAPRPCSLIAAGDTWVIGTSLRNCRADGGPPAFLPYVAINRSTLMTKVVTAPSGLTEFGTLERRRQPRLVANLRSGFRYPAIYPPMAVVLRVGDSHYPIDTIAPGGGQLETPGEGGPEVWSIAGRGSGWTLFHGYGRDYLACALEADRHDRSTCPSGPVILETKQGTFELPPGTWGAVVPPLGFAGL